MSYGQDIYNAFCELVKPYAQSHSPALPIVYDNVPPPALGAAWLRVKMFWGQGDDLGMEAGAAAWDQGRIYVYVYGENGIGTGSIGDIADDIRALFPINTTFGKAKIEQTPELAGPFQDDDKQTSHVTVRVRWRAVR